MFRSSRDDRSYLKSPDETIVARQRISGLFEPLLVGVACLAVGTATLGLIRPYSWWLWLFAAWFWLGGALFVILGIRAWRPAGIGLIVEPRGLWWKCGHLRLLPWNHIAGVRLVRWVEDGTEEQGLLLGLGDPASLDPSTAHWWTCELQTRFGPLPWGTAILLHDDHWSWNPAEVAAQIEARLVRTKVSLGP